MLCFYGFCTYLFEVVYVKIKIKLVYRNLKDKIDKTGVINDPLGQPTVPTGSDCRLILKFWDGRTLCVKIVITTGRDCGRPRGSIFLFPNQEASLPQVVPSLRIKENLLF